MHKIINNVLDLETTSYYLEIVVQVRPSSVSILRKIKKNKLILVMLLLVAKASAARLCVLPISVRCCIKAERVKLNKILYS